MLDKTRYKFKKRVNDTGVTSMVDDAAAKFDKQGAVIEPVCLYPPDGPKKKKL